MGRFVKDIFLGIWHGFTSRVMADIFLASSAMFFVLNLLSGEITYHAWINGGLVLVWMLLSKGHHDPEPYLYNRLFADLLLIGSGVLLAVTTDNGVFPAVALAIFLISLIISRRIHGEGYTHSLISFYARYYPEEDNL